MRRFVMDEPPGPQGDLDTVLLDLDPSVDPAAAEVLLGGVPRRLVGGGYSVLGRAERLTDDLVRFASNESSGYFCIEVQTLHVVEVPDVETTDRVPVNSSLGHFRDAVRMFNA